MVEILCYNVSWNNIATVTDSNGNKRILFHTDLHTAVMETRSDKFDVKFGLHMRQRRKPYYYK
jgi:hypothetical protein